MDQFALLEKYSKPGPRYTSYPTAPHFSESFTSYDWKQELVKSQESKHPLSIYLHIPFCDTLCYFCGCNMIATNRYHRVENYLQTIKKEMQKTAEIINRKNNRYVDQLHWGGGTPSFLKPDDIQRLASWIHEIFGEALNNEKRISKQAETSSEIDPRELTFEHLQALFESGFNRISFGVQDLDEKVQKAVNRIEPESMVREVFSWSKKLGFESINIDLMTGLPHQTIEGFNKTLDNIVELRPNRVAVFAYAHLPKMIKHQNLIPQKSIPDFQTRIKLQILARERLTNAGYINIGMDHYALDDDELVIAQRNHTLGRNFQGYTTRKDCELIGFGLSAISQTNDTYAQNHKKINYYENAIANDDFATMRGCRLTKDDQIRRSAISKIMCHLELDKNEFLKKWGIDFNDYFNQAQLQLEPLVEDELLYSDDNKISVTSKGLPFIRNIAMCFDAYLEKPIDITSNKKLPSFSKTV